MTFIEADFGYCPQYFPGLLDNFGMMCLGHFTSTSKIGDKILRMNWGLCNFKDLKYHLLLADNPCIFTENIGHPDLMIMLPVTPRQTFIATNTNRVANIISEQHPKNLLMRINESSLNQARKRIYARDTSPRCFIFNRITKKDSA
ncbi:MAG: DUF4238 domain-containing protein [Gammaproteobacteria bacterium]|nr:DUF4238 domain-containing protein [Gammaproteobacteria bacterium]